MAKRSEGQSKGFSGKLPRKSDNNPTGAVKGDAKSFNKHSKVHPRNHPVTGGLVRGGIRL